MDVKKNLLRTYPRKAYYIVLPIIGTWLALCAIVIYLVELFAASRIVDAILLVLWFLFSLPIEIPFPGGRYVDSLGRRLVRNYMNRYESWYAQFLKYLENLPKTQVSITGIKRTGTGGFELRQANGKVIVYARNAVEFVVGLEQGYIEYAEVSGFSKLGFPDGPIHLKAFLPADWKGLV